MKTYRIKTNDFAKLTKSDKNLSDEQKQALEKYQNILGLKDFDKILPRGKDIALIISGGKYYITCKPAYIDSMRKILESVNIDEKDIEIMRRDSQNQEISVESLKNILIDNE